jgi:disulfide bond formation protein DsbB
MSTPTSPQPLVSRLALLSALLAVGATAGSLWLSVGMKLKACPLCFYQRTFVMAVTGIFITGMALRTLSPGVLCALALTPAAAGAGVVLFHVWLELSGKLECPPGLFGLGTAPVQSAALLTPLLLLTAAGAWRGLHARAAAGCVLVGFLFAAACIISAPPLPPAPAKAYETPLDMCRPPFRG